MGNLEKAGVLVVVALLAVILVVAFLNFPEQGKTPVLGAAASKVAQAPEIKKAAARPVPVNLYPEPEIIRPSRDLDRSSSDQPPRITDAPVTLVPPGNPPGGPKRDEIMPHPAPISVPKNEPLPPPEEKKVPASAWPKVVKVQSGDSLWSIAVREYGAKVGPRMVGAIADANPAIRPEAMKAGKDLTLPAPPAASGVASKAEGDEPKAPAKAPAKAPSTSKPARRLPFVPE